MGDDSRQPDARAADAKREAKQKKAFHVFFWGGEVLKINLYSLPNNQYCLRCKNTVSTKKLLLFSETWCSAFDPSNIKNGVLLLIKPKLY